MLAAWRPVAESNRSERFCRPLTKSLIQPAGRVRQQVCSQKRVQRYYFFLKYANICSIFCDFLLKKAQIGVRYGPFGSFFAPGSRKRGCRYRCFRRWFEGRGIAT